MRLLALVPCAGCAVALLASACTSTDTSSPPPTLVTSAQPPGTSASTGAPRSTASSSPASSASRSAPSSHSSQPISPPANSTVERTLAGLSLAQKVGQLIMVDCPSSGVAPATVTAIATYGVGSVILDGNSRLGVARTRELTDQLQSDAPRHLRLFVATDQEGGQVQRMRGPGFDAVPDALTQGALPPATLRAQAAGWGRQLRAAGINLDLAPVLDTVPADSTGNPPIGDLDREYGHTPASVTSHGLAVAQGLADAGVDATVKHFPGLGRVSSNTDTTTGVTDYQTTRTDVYLAPFAAAVGEHVPFVMMSTAVYSQLDAGTQAVFSSGIVTAMLRGRLHFTGVIISDDLGAAKQVGDRQPGARAVDFVEAGGDIVLTVDPDVVGAMIDALLARARSDPAFGKKIDAAVRVVLQAKQARGLLD